MPPRPEGPPSGSAPTVPARIQEVKHRLRGGPAQTFRCDLLALDLTPGASAATILYRLPRAIALFGIDLPEGSITLGYFWQDRPYNVYHWLDPDERTLGYYANVADRTAITPQSIVWRDLVLDILILPDDGVHVLDEDELPLDVPRPVARRITAARSELLRDARRLAHEIEHISQSWLTGGQ